MWVLLLAVTTIGTNAFFNCTFEDITSLAANPPELPASSFNQEIYTTAFLHVPEQSEEDYKNADGWKNFLNITATSAINNIYEDDNTIVFVENGKIIAPEGSVVYDISGHKVSCSKLSTGIYIVRLPTAKTVKVKIN